MEKNYSIDEILNAVSELQKIKKETRFKTNDNKIFKKLNSDIPKDTLKLIEEAEKKLD